MTQHLNLILFCFLLFNYTAASILSCVRVHDNEINLSGIVGQDLVKEFKTLNKHLEERTSSEEPDENMKVVREFHQADKKNIFKKDRSRALKAGSLFLALDSLTNECSCNAGGHEIIYQAHRALEGKPFIPENFENCHRRIDKIFLHYYRQHAWVCRIIYPREMREKLKTMDPLKVKRVNFFADNAIIQFTSDSFVDNRSKPLADRLFFVASVETDPQPRYLFKILKFLLKNQAEERIFESSYDASLSDGGLNKNEFNRIYQKYLAEPCKYYEEQLGPDIFVPLTFSIELHDVWMKDVEFYKVWARFQFCKNFNKEVKKKRRELYKYASQRLASFEMKVQRDCYI